MVGNANTDLTAAATKGSSQSLFPRQVVYWKEECWMKPQCRCVSQGKVEKLRQFFSPQKLPVETQLQKKEKVKQPEYFNQCKF